MSAWGNKSLIGVDHTGASKPGARVPPDHPQATLVAHSVKLATGMQNQTEVKTTLGKTPKIKDALTLAPAIRDGMRSRTSPLPGMQHMTDVSGVPSEPQPNVLSPHTPSQAGKRLPTPAIHDGMKTAPDYAHDHAGSAAAVMNEAHAAAAPDDVANLERRIGSLPQSTTENGGDDV